MRDTLLANVGCLAVFQVAGNDARQLVWELGRDRLSEEDITSLPVHQCYVRATVGKERMPAFSMKVRKPEAGNPAVAERIRSEAEGYVTAAQDIAQKDSGLLQLVDKYREKLGNLKEVEKPPAADTKRGPTMPKSGGRRKVRTKREVSGKATVKEASEENDVQ